jgi:hypothetical protein
MSMDLRYVGHSRILAYGRQTHTFVALEPGSQITYLFPDPPKMVALSFAEREVLAFADALEQRAEAIAVPDDTEIAG